MRSVAADKELSAQSLTAPYGWARNVRRELIRRDRAAFAMGGNGGLPFVAEAVRRSSLSSAILFKQSPDFATQGFR